MSHKLKLDEDVHDDCNTFYNSNMYNPRNDNGVIEALKIKIGEQDKTFQDLAKRNVDLIIKNEGLAKKNAELEKITPKKALVTEVEALKEKNASSKKKIGILNVEVTRLKETEKKYKFLLMKFGSKAQRTRDQNTREEIVSAMDDHIVDLYHHFSSKRISEIETINFMTMIYLDMSGGSRLQLLFRLLKFTNLSICKSVLENLKASVPSKIKELKVVIETTAKEDDPEKDDFQVQAQSTPKATISGIKRVYGPSKPKKTSGPVCFDPSFDGFDQTKFQNEANETCKFVRTNTLTYIACSSDPATLMTHKLSNPIPCAIPECDVVFQRGVTIIGRAVICSPEGHEKYGHSLMMCMNHIQKSTNAVNDTELEEAAVNAEADDLAKQLNAKVIKNKAARSLFPDNDADQQPSVSKPVVDEPWGPHHIFMSDEDSDGGNFVRTNKISDLVPENSDQDVEQEVNDPQENDVPKDQNNLDEVNEPDESK